MSKRIKVSLKRKSDAIDDNQSMPPAESSPDMQQLTAELTTYLTRFKKQKKNGDNLNPQDKNQRVTISLSKVVKGWFNLPRKVILEALLLQNVQLKMKGGSGRDEYYYLCPVEGCPYKLKIYELTEKVKHITTAALIQNFKTFSLAQISSLEGGICQVTEYGQHQGVHNILDQNALIRSIRGNICFTLSP